MCPGDECRFLKGSHWVTEHVKRGRKILKETGIGEERLSIAADDEDYHEFLRTLETMGINPLRKGKKVGG
jgi:coenzyme F420-reducing hydrogenase delta subunit